MKENQNYYQTTSIALASAINIFHPLFDVDKTNPKESVFIFLTTDDIQTIIDSFWNKTLTVTPLDYFQSLREVKARLYS